MLGAGGFVFASVLPVIMGSAPTMEQGYLFAVFLVIYVGLALGLRRYREGQEKGKALHIGGGKGDCHPERSEGEGASGNGDCHPERSDGEGA